MNDSLLSVQLYSVREALADDLNGTLHRLAGLGFTQVEPYDILGFSELPDGLASAGLLAPTAHQNFIGGELEPAFERARLLGVQTLIEPNIARERWQTGDGIKRLVDDLAAAADRAAEFGLEIGYHNHDFEFEARIGDGTAYDLFVSLLPASIGLELDTYWVAIGGADPVALLDSLGSRVFALHLKDGPGTIEPGTQVALGSGTMPTREILAAAPDALRVLELEDTRDDRFTTTADSLAFLKREVLA